MTLLLLFLQMDKKCVKCGKMDYLLVYMRTVDGSGHWFRKKDGKKIKECDNIYCLKKYSPLCGYDDSEFLICLECGWIPGMDLKKLKKILENARNESSEETSESEISEEKPKKKSTKNKRKYLDSD